jgi:hypothetical protein
MKCEICGRGPANGFDIFRANEKGVKGIWRCKDHSCKESFENQVEGQWLTDILQVKQEETVQ